MGIADLDEAGKNFLFFLYDRVNNDLSAQVSMYEIGENIGLDRAAASKISEMLIGNDLVEIKTLSGGIGITRHAIEEIRQMHDSAETNDNPAVLGDSLVLAPSDIQTVEAVACRIKIEIHTLGLAFDELAGLIADIKTIEIQLTSSAPKTAIIRECFSSVYQWIEKKGRSDITRQVLTLLGK